MNLIKQLFIVISIVFVFSSAQADSQAIKFVQDVVSKGSANAGDNSYFCGRIRRHLLVSSISKYVAGSKHKEEYEANKARFQGYFAAELALEAGERAQKGVTVKEANEKVDGKFIIVDALLSSGKRVKYKLFPRGNSFKIADGFARGRWLTRHYRRLFAQSDTGLLVARAKAMASGWVCQ